MPTPDLGFPDAARHFGVPLRVLRHAIRSGRIPAPPTQTATASLPAAWLDEVKAALEAAPDALRRRSPQREVPFARYEGTSAWRKYRTRVREYNHYRAGTREEGK